MTTASTPSTANRLTASQNVWIEDVVLTNPFVIPVFGSATASKMYSARSRMTIPASARIVGIAG